MCATQKQLMEIYLKTQDYKAMTTDELIEGLFRFLDGHSKELSGEK